MLSQLPNHFSYLFQNKNNLAGGKKKPISKAKEETNAKALTKKRKGQEQKIASNLKLEEQAVSESVSQNNANNASYSQNSQFNSMILYDAYLEKKEEKGFQQTDSKMELDDISSNCLQHFNADNKYFIQSKTSLIQQEEMEQFQLFEQNYESDRLNDFSINQISYESNQKQSQKINNNNSDNQSKQINQSIKQRASCFNDDDNECDGKLNKKNTDQTKFLIQNQPASEAIVWKRANQIQTKYQTKFRQESKLNFILLKGDLCLEVNQNNFNKQQYSYLPLSAFKRINSIRKYHEGKVEIQLTTDVKVCQELFTIKNEDESIEQMSKSNQSIIESQIKEYQEQIAQQKELFSQIKLSSPTILENLKNHVNIKRQQSLNKIDFERKYIFAVEIEMDEEGTSCINKIYYSKEFLSIMGLPNKDPKDSALLEAYLFKNGVIDLYERIGFYDKKNEDQGKLMCQYLQSLSQSQYTLNTLDNLSINIAINHRVINLSEDFIQMFSDFGQNISKEYLIVHELDIPYDQIKQIESQRKSMEKAGIPYFYTKNIIGNYLLSKYYSISVNQSSSA
ncbi:hypothetical protein ABPG74_004512 [Tetrahymena malaccensis]